MDTTRTRTARKVIGSLGIIGAAAAVAGLGTFGTFTDSTAPLNASVNTGTLSINLTPANDTGSLSLTAAGFVPGDSLSRSVNLVNDGSAAFSALSLTGAATSAPNALLTDATNGLLLALGLLAIVFATINLVGGFVVTDRMLEMFGGRKPVAKAAAASTGEEAAR